MGLCECRGMDPICHHDDCSGDIMRTEEEIREKLEGEGGYGERGNYSAGYENGYHSALEWVLEPPEEEAIIPERCLECPYYKDAIERTLDPPPFRQDDHPIEAPDEEPATTCFICGKPSTYIVAHEDEPETYHTCSVHLRSVVFKFHNEQGDEGNEIS